MSLFCLDNKWGGRVPSKAHHLGEIMARFWLAAALLILSAHSAQAKLGIESIQATYGPLGPERKTLDIYPFDELFFRFTVTGAKPDAEGKVDASVVMQVLDGTGKVRGENQIPA